jgi:hypothetical protein
MWIKPVIVQTGGGDGGLYGGAMIALEGDATGNRHAGI